MTVSIGDFVRITAKMKLFGTDDVMNVYTFRIDRNDTADDDEFMVDAALFLDIVYTPLQEFLSTLLTFVSIDGQNISKSELLPEKPWPVLDNGDSAGALLPTQVAAEVFWPTITPKVRTATFIGGLTELSNDADGSITGGLVATLQAFGEAIQLWETVDVDGVKGSFNPTKVIFTPAGLPVVPARWRTQRRRRVGVGS